MKIAFHGGKCCGIKTLHVMGGNPEQLFSAAPGGGFSGVDAQGGDVSSAHNFYPYALPEESGAKRIDRYLEYLSLKRPKGLVEVTLAYSMQSLWEPALFDRGFKLVSTFVNSNSGNECRVYHLLQGQ